MSNFFIIFAVILIISNFLICSNANSIAKFFKIIDYPNNKRKIHTKPTPLIGGLIFFINIIFFIVFDILTGSHPVTGSQFLFDIRIISIKQIAVLLVASFSIYIVSFYDDVYDIKPFRKILSFLLIAYILTLSNPNLPIKQLQFYNLENSIYFNDFSIYFTLFCILAFMNAANMFDGVNLQSSILYSSFILIFFLKDIDQRFLVIFLIGLIFFTFMNIKGKIFLGNNGSYFLSFIIAIIIILENNWSKNYFVEEIFLYLMIPGIDMIRLTIERFINNKSPFEGDNNHLHHLLMNRFNYKNSILIIFMMIYTPIVLFNFFETNPLLLIVLQFILYLTILLICSKKKTS